MRKKIKVIAHRGNSSEAPENTLVSFQQAIDLSVDFLECDLQITKDGVPVIIHDKTLHRITNHVHVHSINELGFEELQKIDVGSWFSPEFANQRVLTLEEFLLIPRGHIGVMLEVKEETFSVRSLGKNIADVLKVVEPHAKRYGPVLIGSLSPKVVLCLEAYLPEQLIIPVVKNLDHIPLFTAVNPLYWAFVKTLITKEIVNKLHEEQSEVWVWTVDDFETVEKLVAMGVDGIITNYPRKISQFLKQIQP